MCVDGRMAFVTSLENNVLKIIKAVYPLATFKNWMISGSRVLDAA